MTPHELHAYLDAIDPRLWPIAIAATVFAAVWAFRRLFPDRFDGLPKPVQALPAVLLGAAIGGASAGELQATLIEGMIGALSGIASVGLHHTVKRLPGGRR